MRITIKLTLIFLLIFSYISFNYIPAYGWAYSSMGTALILIFSYLIWKNKLLTITGLKISWRNLMQTFGFLIIVTGVSLLLVKYIGSKQGIKLIYNSFGSYFHVFFYVLNEEIILGGIAIYILIKNIKLNPLLASFILALFFPIIHFIFYKYVFLNHGTIQFPALLTLFFVGFIRNNLIITNKHVAFSWSLHFGWIAVMFGTSHYWKEKNRFLTEPECFNVFLGSYEVVILTGVLAATGLFYMIKKHFS